MGESWEDVNSDGIVHRTCINQELGMFCHLLYPGVVTADGQRVGRLLGRDGKNVLGESTSYIFKF
jgi:hypothetical protein